MTTKNMKELADLTLCQCRDKLIELLKDYGMFDEPISTYRIIESKNALVNEKCVIIGILQGEVHYGDSIVEDIEALSVNELYDIIIKL
jgi:hypothetical protein